MTAALGNTAGGTPFATGVDAFVYPQFIGYALRAPTTQDIYNPGTRWQNNAVSPAVQYYTIGAGLWYEFPNTSFGVSSVTGTANQISASPTVGAVVLSLIGPYTPATYTAHGVLVGEGTSSIVALTVGTDGKVLTGNSAADPSFAAIGTKSGLTAHGVVVAEGAGAFAATTAGSAGQVLTSGGASADPTWTTATFPATATSTGTILRADGTNWAASTATYPNTATAGALIAATATNVIGEIIDVAVGQLLASGGAGVIPAYTGSPSVSGSITAATGFVATTAGAGITLNSGTTSGTTTATLNGRSGQITITTPTINAGSTFAMTITNSSIAGSSTQVLYGITGGTTGAAITIQTVANSASQSIVTVMNGSGDTNSTDSLVLTFLVLN